MRQRRFARLAARRFVRHGIHPVPIVQRFTSGVPCGRYRFRRRVTSGLDEGRVLAAWECFERRRFRCVCRVRFVRCARYFGYFGRIRRLRFIGRCFDRRFDRWLSRGWCGCRRSRFGGGLRFGRVRRRYVRDWRCRWRLMLAALRPGPRAEQVLRCVEHFMTVPATHATVGAGDLCVLNAEDRFAVGTAGGKNHNGPWPAARTGAWIDTLF